MDVDFLAVFKRAEGAFLSGDGAGCAGDLDVDLGGGFARGSAYEEVAAGDAFFTF